MSEGGLTSQELRQRHADDISNARTFQTAGVSDQVAKDYLDTEEGQRYREALIRADPNASISDIDQRAIDQITSGRERPRMETISDPLVKIVPRGEPVSAYSPFFARQSAFDDAVARGLNLSEHFALPISSEAQVYDVYEIRPRGPTEVFVNTVAPTSELGGQVVKPGGAEQYLVPNRSLYSDASRIGSIGNDLSLHREMVEGRGLGPSIAAISEAGSDAARAPRLAGAGRALGIAGLALEAYDGAQTVRTASRLRSEGNDTAAESELIHFGSRSIGGLGGGAIGVGIGGAATSWSGPGMLIGGGLGGVAGVFGGEKFAQWNDNRNIYNQQDRSGNTWTYAPDRPERGWERAAPVDITSDGIDNARRGSLRASPALSNELDYKATSTSVELILGSPPAQRNPFTQPEGAQDARSSRPSSWEHDPESGQWARRVYGPFVERGMTPSQLHTAAPERASELDRAAAQIVLENASNSPASIAARYEDAYIRSNWAAYGPVPEAVRSARTDIDTLVASDENRYQRQADGRWVSNGLIFDSTAAGQLHAELNASREVLGARLPPPREITPPAPMTEGARLRDTVLGAYRNANIEASTEHIEIAAAAVRATWEANKLDSATTALAIRPDAVGRYSLDSPIGSMRLEGDGRTYRVAAITSVGGARSEERISPSGDPVVDRWIGALQDGDHAAAKTTQAEFNRSPEGQRLWDEALAEARYVETQEKPWLAQARHSPLFNQAMKHLEELEPRTAQSWTQEQREQVAGTIALEARRGQLPQISELEAAQDGSVVAIWNSPHNRSLDRRTDAISLEQAAEQPLQQSMRLLDDETQRQDRQSVIEAQQRQVPEQQLGFSM